MLWAFWHLPFVVTGEDFWIDALLFRSQMFSGADSVNQAWLRLSLWGVVAIVLVIVYGSQNLSRKHQKQVEPPQPVVSAAASER